MRSDTTATTKSVAEGGDSAHSCLPVNGGSYETPVISSTIAGMHASGAFLASILVVVTVLCLAAAPAIVETSTQVTILDPVAERDERLVRRLVTRLQSIQRVALRPDEPNVAFLDVGGDVTCGLDTGATCVVGIELANFGCSDQTWVVGQPTIVSGQEPIGTRRVDAGISREGRLGEVSSAPRRAAQRPDN